MTEKHFYIVHGALDRNSDLLRLTGRLDESGCTPLIEAIDEAITAGRRSATIDFAEVTSISGGGLFPLYMAATRAKRRGLSLFAVGLDESKRSVLKAARLDAGMVLVRALSEARMMANLG